MLEAICEKCDETFIPADENDTEHIERVDGTRCGGQGAITGKSGQKIRRPKPPSARWVYATKLAARSNGLWIVLNEMVDAEEIDEDEAQITLRVLEKIAGK